WCAWWLRHSDERHAPVRYATDRAGWLDPLPGVRPVRRRLDRAAGSGGGAGLRLRRPLSGADLPVRAGGISRLQRPAHGAVGDPAQPPRLRTEITMSVVASPLHIASRPGPLGALLAREPVFAATALMMLALMPPTLLAMA